MVADCDEVLKRCGMIKKMVAFRGLGRKCQGKQTSSKVDPQDAVHNKLNTNMACPGPTVRCITAPAVLAASGLQHLAAQGHVKWSNCNEVC